VELVRCLLTAIIRRNLGGLGVHLENAVLEKVGSVRRDGTLGGAFASFPLVI
jgi:hypothetical protein